MEAEKIEAWFREWFCNRQNPLVTEVYNELRAAVDDLKIRFTPVPLTESAEEK